MKQISSAVASAVFLLPCALFSSLQSGAQQAAGPDDFIRSRQAEVGRLGSTFYSTDLNAPRWNRHRIAHCEAFTHHTFASFEDGGPTRYVAIYDLDRAPAPSANKPWLGGVRVLRLRSTAPQDADMNDEVLLAGLNHAIAEENVARSASVIKTVLDSAGVADCLVHIAGHETTPVATVPGEAPPPPSTAHRVTTIMVPLVSPAGKQQSEYLEFDNTGAITRAQVLEQRVRTPK